MAAATMAGPDSHRMEEKKFEYFSSINSMASKIMQERQKIKNNHGSTWDKMTPQEQDSAIDNWMMDPQIRARYAMHRVDREEVVCYPKLLIQTGQKIVHFGEEVRTHRCFFLFKAQNTTLVTRREPRSRNPELYVDCVTHTSSPPPYWTGHINKPK